MRNPRLAFRYAKSLVDLSVEMNVLDETRQDVLLLQNIMKSSREFVVMLNSPVIKSDKKFKIIDAIAGKRISRLTYSFLELLTRKNREANLPAIANAFITEYNRIRGLHTAKLTTAQPISKELTDIFIQKIKASSNIEHLQLETAVNDKLIGGYVLEMEGKLIDASILRDLNDVKKQFANNDYLHRLR